MSRTVRLGSRFSGELLLVDWSAVRRYRASEAAQMLRDRCAPGSADADQIMSLAASVGGFRGVPDTLEQAIELLAERIADGSITVVTLEPEYGGAAGRSPSSAVYGEPDWDDIRPLSDLRETDPTITFGALSIELVDHTGIPFRDQELKLRRGDGGTDRIVLDAQGKWSTRSIEKTGTCKLVLPARLELTPEQLADGGPDGFQITPGDLTVRQEQPGELSLPRYDVHYRIVVEPQVHLLTRVELGATGFSFGGVLLLPRAGAGRFHPWAALTGAARHRTQHPDARLVVLGHCALDEPPEHAAHRVNGVMHLVRNERDAWVALAAKWGRVVDVQSFVDYLRAMRRWALPYVAISGEFDDATRHAVEAFQRIYNEVFAAGESILEDGVIGVQTLGAVFDVARSDLLEWLEHGETEIGMLGFDDTETPLIACPPNTRPARALAPTLPGQYDGRFVDLVLLSNEDFARITRRAVAPAAGVYDTNRVETLSLDGTTSPRKGLLQLRLVTSDGRPYGDAPYTLRVDADHRIGTTSPEGSIGEDGLAAGLVLIEVEGGRIVFHDAYRASPHEATSADDESLELAGAPATEGAWEPAMDHAEGEEVDPDDRDESDDEDGGDEDDDDASGDDDEYDDVVILDDDFDPAAPSEPDVPPDPSPLAGDATVDVYCTEPACPIHAEAPGRALPLLIRDGYQVPDTNPPPANPVPCPLCRANPPREGLLVYTPREPAAVVPAEWDAVSGAWRTVVRAASAMLPSASDAKPTLDPAPTTGPGVPLGVVLPLRPYGGHVLTRGNADASKTYGPSNADPLGPLDPAKPQHVQELQRDLARLGYLDGRPKQKHGADPGVFDDFVAGAVIALKRDLVTFYGVRTTLRLAEAEVAGSGPLPLAGLDGPILFDTALKNDALIYLEGIRNALSSKASAYLKLENKGKNAKKNYWVAFVKRFKTSRHFPSEQAKLVLNALRELTGGLDAIALDRYPGERSEASFADVIAHPVMQAARHAKKAMTAWTREIGNLLSISPAAARMRDEARTLVSPPDATVADVAAQDSLLTELEAAADRFAGFDAPFAAIVGGVPASTATYLARLWPSASVDRATALYIKAMVNGVRVGHGGATKRTGGTLAFRFPTGGSATAADDLGKRAILDLVLERNRSGAKVPPMYALERFCGESGLQQFGRPLQRYAFTKAERNERHPLMGLDWNNRGGSSFVFNAFWTRGPGEGVNRSLALSRGWGIGQFTIGTRLPGVTQRGRSTRTLDMNWACGLPISPDNVTVTIPRELNTTIGGIDVALNLLRTKFHDNSARRDCTYEKVGGRRYDCHNCLARFIPAGTERKSAEAFVTLLERTFVGTGAITEKGTRTIVTYYFLKNYDPSDPVQVTFFMGLMGEAPAVKDADARREFPCSWLTAVMRYAGSGQRAIARLRKFVANVGRKSIAAKELNPLFVEYIEKVENDGVDF